MDPLIALTPVLLASALCALVIGAILVDRAAQLPSDPEALKQLALARGIRHDPVGAVRALRKAVALAPERADLWAQLGEACVVVAMGQVDAEARRAFGHALRNDPANASARFHLALPGAEGATSTAPEGAAPWTR